MHKINIKNTGKSYEIRSKLTIKTPDRRWRRRRHFGVFTVSFKLISHFLVFLVVRMLSSNYSKC